MPNLTWVGPFSTKHPKVDLEFLSLAPASDGEVVSEMWIRGLPAGVWGREIARMEQIRSVDCLAELGQGALYRIRSTRPPIVNLYRKLSTPLPFPLRLRAGYLEWEIVARAPQFAEVVLFAREADPRVQVTWLRSGPLHAHLPRLTPDEQRLLAKALRQGYFSVPPGATPISLGRSVGLSEDAVLRALQRIETALLASTLQDRSLG